MSSTSTPQPNLLTFGDENYFTTISKSVKKFFEFYPGGHAWVYDWGFTDEQRESLLTHDKLELIDWEWQEKLLHYELVATEVAIDSWLAEVLKRFPRIGPFLAERVEPFVENERSEWYYMQKPYIIRDCASRIRDGPLVFVDGDAIVVNELPVLSDESVDVGVTLRPHEEIEAARERGDYHVLNAGVILWNCSPQKIRAFTDEWIDRMHRCELPLREQSSLSKLVESIDSDIYDEFGNTGTLSVNSEDIRVKVLDMREYNYNWIDEGWNPAENRILHFKSGRHEDVGDIVSEL